MLANAYTKSQHREEDSMHPCLQEALALERANMLLQNAIDNPTNDDVVDVAIRKTGLLWAIFQEQLSEPNHPMPIELRANVISLSMFIDKQLFKARAEDSVEPLKSVININTQIALGLKENITHANQSMQDYGGINDTA